MSWLKNKFVSLFHLLCIKVVKMVGRVPKHIAFIMDGNRRFAKRNHLNTTSGHHKGYDKLTDTITWCLALGIPEVTVYALSIENFQRSKDEVDALMNLARKKFTRMLDNMDQLRDQGVRVHFAGRLSLLPDDLRSLTSRIMIASRHHDKLRLNVACAYTGRDEISRAASVLVNAVQSKQISPADIDETLVSQTMELSEPELLVRTSGEVRLSDFMLWQRVQFRVSLSFAMIISAAHSRHAISTSFFSHGQLYAALSRISNTVLYFTDVLWPDFSVWDMLAAIIHYQRYGPERKLTEHINEHKKKMLENLETQRWKDLEKIAAVKIAIPTVL